MPRARISRILLPLLLTLLLCSGPLCPNSLAEGKESREVKFRWAFGAMVGNSSAPRAERVSGDTILNSGDKLRVMIELRKKCFVYLIHLNSQGEITMLFPYNLKQFDTDYEPGRRYYVPKGEAWFQLDTRTGKEIFNLIASDQRLLDIEYLYDMYVSAGPLKKPELAERMASEIGSLRRQYQVSGGQAEVLARNEAEHRGFERATGADPLDIAGLAMDVSFNNLYSKTITVEHR
ncbi:MAG: DUF4384 domain-containing protein [Syntrophobacteraceae bacterium]